MKRYLLIALGFFALTQSLKAQPEAEPDSVSASFIGRLLKGNIVDFRWMVVPTIAYQPETSWAFGASGAYYFNTQEASKTSVIIANAAYTLNNQFTFHASTSIYFPTSQQWMLYASAGIKRYPDYFYGIGNHASSLLPERISYNTNQIYLNAQPQYYLNKKWLIGASIAFRWEHASPHGGLDSSYCASLEKGFEPYTMIGLGVLTSYDSRNNLFYTTQGLFFKGILNYYEPHLGSSYRMAKLSTDLRHFIPIHQNLSFAWQMISDWTFGKHKPFQMLPTLGGVDLIRGVRRYMWQDDVMLAVQGELRIPIWGVFKGAIFGGIGDVYNLNNWHFSTPKIGYGAGLRVKINNENVHLRLDAAKHNLGDNWSFYITINEAF